MWHKRQVKQMQKLTYSNLYKRRRMTVISNDSNKRLLPWPEFIELQYQGIP